MPSFDKNGVQAVQDITSDWWVCDSITGKTTFIRSSRYTNNTTTDQKSIAERKIFTVIEKVIRQSESIAEREFLIGVAD